MKTIRIGTRGSKLALWQANHTRQQLERQGLDVILKIIKTKGDQIQNLSFDKIEGKGFFTKEIEEALLQDEIDLAVHSMKDLPTTMDERLMIAGVSARADPSDWLIIKRECVDRDAVLKLRNGAQVGTSSVRRKCQIMEIRNDIEPVDIRGNVPTRLEKLRHGSFHAIMLAAAGINRLEISLDDFQVVKLHPREFVPAPAQGVIAYQTKRADEESKRFVSKIHDSLTAKLTNVERKILRLFNGGCHLPLGAYCEKDVLGNYHVWASYAPTLSDRIRRSKLSYNTTQGLAEGIYANLTK